MQRSIRFGEILIFLTGVLLLGNVWFIGLSGDFTYWMFAKILYVIGVVLFILNR